MKLHCSKILLFLLPLNILVTSLSNVHSKNKPYITPRHTPTTTSRVLRECDLYISNYDKDADMKSVKEIFDRQTSQRFEEYEERMQEKRKKRKEQCDKNVQEIIEKDKREKSLEEKIERGCLKCGCGLGGVAASVGLFGGLGIYGWKPAALATAKEAAVTEATALATQAGMNAVILKIEGLSKIFKPREGFVDLRPIVNKLTYNNGDALVATAKELFDEACTVPDTGGKTSFCNTTIYIKKSDLYVGKFGKIGSDAYDATLTTKTTVLTEAKVGAVEATYGGCQTAITASVIAILIIVLVMIIIYLILRYRRKKKMKKKQQYTKLLNQ
ncbi:hypothetical protein PFTANZ_04203 [Plasmodium falciparum Tanzania (2000708)]|uniref:Surface antigen n=1 Tax=Plasmodium falciparum Tanzania (2000708) TaxID=1036725 RepID=A0A024W4I3_PLAFA|nr:hypothetical protein PFTANZ_04203 [Plasmodium falciparum Tanzania (2000708)]